MRKNDKHVKLNFCSFIYDASINNVSEDYLNSLTLDFIFNRATFRKKYSRFIFHKRVYQLHSMKKIFREDEHTILRMVKFMTPYFIFVSFSHIWN